MRLKSEDIDSPDAFDSNEEATAWYLYYLLHEQVNQSDSLYRMENDIYEIAGNTRA